MAKKINSFVKVNEPHVVHETIEGETILLHLATGNYYSIKWPGTTIWTLLEEIGDPETVIREMCSHATSEKKMVEQSVELFIDSLLQEELLVNTDESLESAQKVDTNLSDELEKVAAAIDKLELNKFTDMQDMLLLDPIHDVDEKGWPEPKKKKK